MPRHTNALRPRINRFLGRVARSPAGGALAALKNRLVLPLQCWWTDVGDRRGTHARGPLPLPPASLRYRVHGSRDAGSFLSVGEESVRCMLVALKDAGLSPESFHRVLDFGCGCGRTLRAWRARHQPTRLAGIDIDRQAIAWCRANLDFAEFQCSDPDPPAPFSAGSFDLIYAVSVFTHLKEPDQFRWLRELQRLLRPGGALVVSLHGERVWRARDASEVELIARNGFLSCSSNSWRGIFPDWYQSTFHTEGYVRQRFGEFFDVRAYLPAGLAGHHDLVVLEKADTA